MDVGFGRRFGIFIAVGMALLFAFAGCKEATPGMELAGKWQTTDPKYSGMIYEYKSDGTFTASLTKGSKTAVVTGTYKVTGDDLATTITDTELNGKKITPPTASKTDHSNFKISGDICTLSQPGGSGTMELKKL